MSDTLIPPDLTSCDREPIHGPGSIQPHGIMVVADQDSFVVRHVAGDIEHPLGVIGWMGQPLAVLIGEALSLEISVLIESEATGGVVGQLKASTGEMLDVSVQLSKPYVIVELETATTEGLSASRVIYRLATAAAGFERATSLIVLCERAAIEFRRLTGFDQIMVYRFLDDDAGKGLAENRRDDLRSFLNHHFPASDIQRQARALYVRNLLRVIPDASYEPVVLRPEWTAAVPLDMSDSSLRSVSPIHLLYLRNMGVMASASFSIIKDGLLWGLIACHNETPRSLTYDVRAACRSLVAVCGASPVLAFSSKTTRHRLNQGGDRAANSALHIIAIGRLRTDPRTKAYMAKHVAERHSKLEVIGCLKRYIAREVFALVSQRRNEINQVRLPT